MPVYLLRLSIFLCLFFAVLHTCLALTLRDEKALWLNVPASPGAKALRVFFLGDSAMAYRGVTFMLQNLGNVGGRNEKLTEYDYSALEKWMLDSYTLDSHSNAVPVLAAYYFSATQNPEQLGHIVDYLAYVGNNEEGQKWRWLAQAAYIARYGMKDTDLALSFATTLSKLKSPGMPGWARQMPAIILSDMGKKEAALGMIAETMRSHEQDLSPQEIFVMKEFICRDLLTPEDKESRDFCQDSTGKLF